MAPSRVETSQGQNLPTSHAEEINRERGRNKQARSEKLTGKAGSDELAPPDAINCGGKRAERFFHSNLLRPEGPPLAGIVPVTTVRLADFAFAH